MPGDAGQATHRDVEAGALPKAEGASIVIRFRLPPEHWLAAVVASGIGSAPANSLQGLPSFSPDETEIDVCHRQHRRERDTDITVQRLYL